MVRININILSCKKNDLKGHKKPATGGKPFAFRNVIIAYHIWVETQNCRWKQSTKHHSFTLQTWYQQYKWDSRVLFCVSNKVLYHENTKIRVWVNFKKRLIDFHINSTKMSRLVKQKRLSFSSTEINEPLVSPVKRSSRSDSSSEANSRS